MLWPPSELHPPPSRIPNTNHPSSGETFDFCTPKQNGPAPLRMIVWWASARLTMQDGTVGEPILVLTACRFRSRLEVDHATCAVETRQDGLDHSHHPVNPKQRSR